ncbi:MAG TPA: hypothetical protein VLX90_02740 [Steroidobacteraceae bacterium]|nr:hypothetical protein [Steroidobacteraceae bacterium]
MDTLLRSLRVSKPLVAVACILSLAAICLTACGGTTTDLPSGVVAEVGGTPITKATLDHWMVATLGSDYYTVTSHEAPATLLAAPPDHASCVAELERIDADANARKVTGAQIKSLCGELYEAIKEQALTFLISAQSEIASAKEDGVKVTGKQVQQAFAGLFPDQAELKTYLARRHRTLADELLVVKVGVVNEALLRALAAAAKSGNGRVDTKAIEERGVAQDTRLVRETNCRQGYVVARCRQYPYYVPGKIDQNYRGNPPAKILFEIGRLQPATSHGFTGRPQGHRRVDTECHDAGKRLHCVPVFRKKR